MDILKKLLVKEIVAPILIVLGAIILCSILTNIINKVFKIRSKRTNNRKQDTIKKLITNILRYLIIIIAFLMILEVYGINTTSLITSLGIVGLVVGLALQDLIKDFIAGTFIVLENSYNVGDVVTINGFKGTVTDLGVRTTRIESIDGDVLTLNNGGISQVINHSMSDSLAVVDVTVAYESDLKKVEKVLTNFCGKISKEIEDIKEDATLLGVQDLGDSGITFRITAVVNNGTHFQVQRDIRKLVKIELDKNNIDIPYPHVTVINHE